MPPKQPTPSPSNLSIVNSWSSSSTGHQRSDIPYGVARARQKARARKIEHQLRSGDCLPRGTKGHATPRAFDGTRGPRSPSPRADADGEWKWVTEAEGERAALGVRDIRSFMGVSKRTGFTREPHEKMKVGESTAAKGEDGVIGPRVCDAPASTSTSVSTPDSPADRSSTSTIFSGTTIFINGSTLPQISDIKLRHLLIAHGARLSISMARKSVSHVIVGKPITPGSSGAHGAGGGLAARKLQQEIARGGYKGVKIVGVDWVLESIKVGKRVAESRFAVVHTAGKGQKSVASMFGRS
ncbi:hypothetical protein N7492_002090 [Penicillium capsulatum]|uniref:BRCT domain-containing protein n=1 Tax=Penicillium capsulatum TaxID=69766 RepID=A0A9W9IHZ2_9EURO|nr:hypothetical protein N7492_002090 [Penicillium capsulatum]